jgi:heme-degrading monooxygenase HmoA
LKEEIFPAIGDRKVNGYKGIQLFRRPLDSEIEFITIMWFASLDAVRAFAGEDYEVGVVPPKARALLSRFDARSQHYEIKERLEY